MPTKTSRREFWNGDPERLPDGFKVTKPKGDHVLTAVCEVWTHQMGWELRLQVDGEGLLMSSVTRSGAEMLARVEECDAGEGLDGMSEHPTRPAVREEIWDRFVDALDRAGQAGNAADVLTPTALHPDAPSGKRFGDLTRGGGRQSRINRAKLWQARRRRADDVAAHPAEAQSTKPREPPSR